MFSYFGDEGFGAVPGPGAFDPKDGWPSGTVGAGLVEDENVGLSGDAELLGCSERCTRRGKTIRTYPQGAVPGAGVIDPEDVQLAGVI